MRTTLVDDLALSREMLRWQAAVVSRLSGLRRFISPLVLILLWQGASISPRTLAAPSTIVATAWQLTATGELPYHLLVSLQRVALGLGLGVSTGALLAIVAGLSRLGEEVVDAPVQMLRTLPFLALVPLFILWFGIGETPKIALVALGSAFPVYLTLFAGIRGTDPKLAEMGRVFGLDRRGLVWEIVLPAAVPSGLVGLRYALGTAWLSLVIAEQVNANAGIGYLINDARDFLRRCTVNAQIDTASRAGYGVRVHELTRAFGEHAVLDALDLELQSGAFVALLGRSGSGKTTLLRTLAGLDAPHAQTVVSVPAPAAVVFQEPRLLPWRRVWRNVALGLQDSDPRARARTALREVGLAHRMDAWPATLSGGEAQRAALARALVRSPRLLLLDEPFASLDALTRIHMHGLVLDLWRAHRPTTLLVTYDVDEAVLLAERALVLADGRIVADVAIDLPRPRSHGHPHFTALRRQLLAELGVRLAAAEADEIAGSVPSDPPSLCRPDLADAIARDATGLTVRGVA